MIKEKIIFGLHSVREAFESGKEIDKVFIKKGQSSEEVRQIKILARTNRVPVLEVPNEKLNRITRSSHQGCIAIIAQITYVDLEMLIPKIYEEGRDPFIVVLDGITDTRNFGAIARSAECAGVDAIVIPERGSVSVTADAVNTSAGALMRIPVCRVTSIPRAVAFLADSGLKIIIANEKATNIYYNSNLTGPLVFVLGNEHNGVSSQVIRMATQEVSIPQMGKIGSLNVSVAGGVLLFESLRQKGENLNV